MSIMEHLKQALRQKGIAYVENSVGFPHIRVTNPNTGCYVLVIKDPGYPGRYYIRDTGVIFENNTLEDVLVHIDELFYAG